MKEITNEEYKKIIKEQIDLIDNHKGLKCIYSILMRYYIGYYSRGACHE